MVVQKKDKTHRRQCKNVIIQKNKPVKELCGRCLSEAQNHIHPPPPHTHCLRVYSRLEPERRLEGQQFTKLGRKYYSL
jgi:hypothetical protein